MRKSSIILKKVELFCQAFSSEGGGIHRAACGARVRNPRLACSVGSEYKKL